MSSASRGAEEEAAPEPLSAGWEPLEGGTRLLFSTGDGSFPLRSMGSRMPASSPIIRDRMQGKIKNRFKGKASLTGRTDARQSWYSYIIGRNGEKVKAKYT